MYSFLLSYRHVVGDPSKTSTYKKVGMKSGNNFIPFFISHSRINQNLQLVKYPASSVHLIFEYLNNNAIFSVIQSMLVGKSLVFVADNPNILTDVMFGFQQLLYPL